MNKFKSFICFFLLFVVNIFYLSGQSGGNYVLVIHGGAGNVTPERIDDEIKPVYVEELTGALLSGERILKNGGSGLDAVEAAVRFLEDSPLFNAGKGAVFTAEGKNELDASIMCGKQVNSGAVASVTNVKNPVSAARMVMEESPHVLLVGEGAERFSSERGLEIVDPSYFFDQRRWDSYKEWLRRMEKGGSGNNEPREDGFTGTVGAVALDMNGNLAAATSTGGMTGKKFGRVGDSPIIGAGTYANNKTCAVSATGHGEYFIRNVVAYDISARMEYQGESLKEAADYVINNKLKEINASGGIIAVDKDGNYAMPFNTEGMFRGYVNSKGELEVKMFGDD